MKNTCPFAMFIISYNFSIQLQANHGMVAVRNAHFALLSILEEQKENGTLLY